MSLRACTSGSPHCLLGEEASLPEPGWGKQWLEPKSVALSLDLQENFCRAADFLQLFCRAHGLKGEVWLHLESCPQRGMAGVGGEEGGCVAEREEEGG